MNTYRIALLIFLIPVLNACKVYKQDIMFQLEEDFQSSLQTEVTFVEQNYRLLPDDFIQLEVFTNKGERAIDPNFEFGNQSGGQNIQQNRNEFQYLIQSDGEAKLPIIGKVKLADLTVDEAEKMLEQEYNRYYKESFVKLKVINRRVVVLGALGGQVIPLSNENTSLIEVIAQYGGINLGSKATNIRVIRGDLSNPKIFLIDLSSVDGMKKSMIQIESGDIIYIEPWRRPWLESIRDIAPVFNIITSVIALVVLIETLAN